MIHQLIRKQEIAADADKIWEFFATPQNLDLMTPASLSFQIIGDVAPQMYAGQMIEYRVGLLPGLSTRWVTEITHVTPGRFFVDEQRIGPYRLWHHEHEFHPLSGGGGVSMIDRVTFDVGRGPLGEFIYACWIKRRLAEIFDFRARKVAALFQAPGSA